MSNAASTEYLDSYYAASARLPPLTAALAGAHRTDIAVIGGGIAGCSAALALAERGYRVVLLEAQRIGWGASGRSGGQAIFGTAAEQAQLEQLLGVDDARRIWEISLAGLALLRQRIGRYQIECDWQDGWMLAAVKPRQWSELQELQADLSQRYGYDSTRLMERAELRATVPSERYAGALYDRNSGHLHPLRYTLGLAHAATQAGVEIHEASRALDYTRRDGRIRVRTEAATLDCEHLVLAGNAWLGDTAPPLRRKLMTIGSYIIATEPLGEDRARGLIANNAALCDMNWILDYFRRSSDHRLLFGGRVNYSLLNVRAVAPGHAGAHDQRISAAARCARRLRLGLPARHHAEPRATFRPARAQRLFSTRLLRPRHRAHRHRRTTGGRGDRRHRRALRRVHPHTAPQLPRRHAAAAPGIGAGDALVPAARSYVTSAPQRLAIGAKLCG
jgi:gamma-glutamylputrescine oxidase